jgi:prepilin-type N-terminal cleavage/methylation domain-containing protein
MVRKTEGHVSGGLRPAFTLVELLVVIIIIAILAAIAVPAVMRATATAQNARIKSEIDMLHMAIQQYKNEYGSFPPCYDAPVVAGNLGQSVARKHIQRIFPRVLIANLPSQPNLLLLRPNNAIATWLLGYTDDPTDPTAQGDKTLKRKKLFDFDQSRTTADFRYAPPSKPNSVYQYIDSSNYGTPGMGVTPEIDPKTSIPFNPDSFQIICAGRDEKYGNDDDLSNFWPGTRKDYLDSLK